jgi:hypothetical protein
MAANPSTPTRLADNCWPLAGKGDSSECAGRAGSAHSSFFDVEHVRIPVDNLEERLRSLPERWSRPPLIDITAKGQPDDPRR